MLLEQVKSLNLRLSQSFSLPVAMVLQATSATCGMPPATAFHYRMRAAAFALSQFLSLSLLLSIALEKVCHDFLSVAPTSLTSNLAAELVLI